MKLIEACIKYPVTVLVGVLLGILFGGIALLRLPWQMTPTIDRPEITVSTEYKGAAPLEVEQEITDRIEKKLNSVENLSEMTSSSFEGNSRIIMKFDWGINKDVARLDVSEKLGLVKDLPPDAEESVIRAVNTDEVTPIAWVIIRTDRPINEVWEEADDVIRPRMERIEGVATVWMFGGEDREVHVILDPEAMSAREISVAQVRDALLEENRNVKGGRIEEGKRRYVIRTLGQFTDIRQIPHVVIRQDARGTVYIRDIAHVRFGYEDKERVVRVWDRPTIGFGVLRRSGSNTLKVMEGVKDELRYLNDLYRGKDIELVQVYDETDYIYDSVELVTTNLFYGAFLAVAVLLLFLRSPSSIFILAFAIPISLVTTFVVLDALGRTLNIVMLAGLAFASGMVVDSSIVVLENIYRHRQRGKGKVQAAQDGAVEVWGAVLASTLTTVFVFIPIIFVKEEAGQLFRDIAIAISTAVALSLIVSVTVVPMLSARLLALNPEARNPTRRSFWRILDRLRLDEYGGVFVEALVGWLNWLRQGFGRRIVVALTIILAAVSLSYLFMPPIDYLPQGNRNLIFVLIRTTPGMNVGQREEILIELERRFDLPEIHRMFAVARVQNTIMGAIVHPEYHTLSGMRRVITEMRRRSKGIPGTEGIFITQSPLFRRRGSFIGGTNLEVEVKGDSLEQVHIISERLRGDLSRLPQVNFVNTSFEAGNPELQIRVDRAKASQLGLSAGEVGYIVETMVHGTGAGQFRERGKELDIILKGSSQYLRRTQDLEQIVFFAPTGRLVKLSDIATVRLDTGPTKVEHIDRDRAIKVTVNVKGEVPLEKAVQLVDQVVEPVRRALPLGTTIDVAGQAQDLSIAWNSIKWSFLLALVVIYLLMCSLFESWSYPLIIMFTVPLAATGGILAVRLAHAFEPTIKMDVITMLGFVILAGIVVNNAILIIHQALNHMREGSHSQEAILESVRTRIRPIFMTTATTVFGMLPLVFARGSGSELYRGLGAAVLGGLIVSSLFTLILIPTLFSLWMDAKGALAARLSRKPRDEVTDRPVAAPAQR
ncbi:MAG: efflux RND transporter permease subunit [candidate division NC10 bacterium]|nr:efflux RND transporter permease subunit [candidate division NC10 bacterium]